MVYTSCPLEKCGWFVFFFYDKIKSSHLKAIEGPTAYLSYIKFRQLPFLTT